MYLEKICEMIMQKEETGKGQIKPKADWRTADSHDYNKGTREITRLDLMAYLDPASNPGSISRKVVC